MTHGGARPNSGRPKGTKDRATSDMKATFSDQARALAPEALEALAGVMRSGTSESAVVSAANSILDRGYGRPIQAVEHARQGGVPIAFDGWIITRAQPDPVSSD